MALTMGLSLAGCVQGLFLFAHLQTFATALRLHRLTVPELQDYREHATLACEYELISNKLNSVKWYKDGSEFFRYAPMQQPTVSMFKVAGIHVHNNSIDCDTQSCRIQLWYLQPQSSGVYRCEVSGDAPDFKLVSRVANMTVGVLPQHDPIVTGLLPLYAYGDFMLADCMTDKSSPPSTISWSINDVPILQHQQQTLMRSSDVDYATGSFPQQNRSQDISFYIDQTDWGQFRQLTVKCTASVDGFPQHRRHTERLIDVGVSNTVSNERLVNQKNDAIAQRRISRWLELTAACTLLIAGSCRAWC